MLNPTTFRQRLSACLIVKNEEAKIGRCLASIAGLVDEIVVADTGSHDRTKEIAKSFGAIIVDFPWCDNFAAARNASLDAATGDWIFWLDADEWLNETNRQRFRIFRQDLPADYAVYLMKLQSRQSAGDESGAMLDQAKFFPRHPEVRWLYRVHEQILPTIRRLNWPVRRAEPMIFHDGLYFPPKSNI